MRFIWIFLENGDSETCFSQEVDLIMHQERNQSKEGCTNVPHFYHICFAQNASQKNSPISIHVA
jgi:hypothetical protein